MSSTFLDSTEMAELTGRVRSDAQVRALRHMGIEHRVRPDGKVVVLRNHVEQVLGGALGGRRLRVEKPIEPNWGAI